MIFFCALLDDAGAYSIPNLGRRLPGLERVMVWCGTTGVLADLSNTLQNSWQNYHHDTDYLKMRSTSLIQH